MLPAALVELAEFPRTPNGKLDVAALPAPVADSFGQSSCYVAPRDALEKSLAELWSEILDVPRPSVQDTFFSLGGHSLLALRLLARVHKAYGIDLPVAVLMQGPTIERLALELRARGVAQGAPTTPSEGVRAEPRAPSIRLHSAAPFNYLVPLKPSGNGAPLFCLPGAGGDVLALRAIVNHLGIEQPIFGVQARGIDGKTEPFESITQMADAYLKEIRSLQPHGPYYLSGYCGGGVIAFELAGRLQQLGERVNLLALVDAQRPGAITPRPRRLSRWFKSLGERGPRGLIERIRGTLRRELREAWTNVRIAWHRWLGNPIPHELRPIWLTQAFFRAEAGYTPPVYRGRLTLFRPRDNAENVPDFGWNGFVTGSIEVQELPGNHETLVREPHVMALAAALRTSLLRSQGVERR